MIYRKYCVLLCLVLFLLSGCLNHTSPPSKANIRILGKGGFESIQSAIDNADKGDIIVLTKGIYYEQIHINKSIQLYGEDNVHSIIDGNNHSPLCILNANNIHISNLSMRNTSLNPTDSAILVQGNNTVLDNLIVYNSMEGIYVAENTKNTTIKNSNIYHSRYGIHVKDATENRIINNTIVNNSGFGLYLDFYGNSNEITNNIIAANEIGIRIKTAAYNIITKNWIMNNTAKGIYICCSGYNNMLYENYLINNIINAEDHFSNYWFHNTIGNYWSDYEKQNPEATDENHDGIWDEPYHIRNGENTDDYPLAWYPPNFEW